MRETIKALGCLAVALLAATIARGEDARVFELVRRAPAVGDTFRAEFDTSFRHGNVGQALKDGVTNHTAFTCSIIAAKGTDAFDAKLVLDPETTTVENDGVATTTTTEGKTVVKPMSARELTLVPTLQDESGSLLSPSRTKLALGETWTSENVVKVGVIDVPVAGSYRVASVEKDASGRELVRVEFSSKGSTTKGGSKFSVIGNGHTLIDPKRAERPVEVELSYRFVAEGDGEGVESRSETKIRTSEVSK